MTLPSKKQNLPKNHNSNIRTAIGFVISAFFLWLTFRDINFSSFKIIPHRQSLVFLFAAMLVLLLSVWLQSLRMKLFWLAPNRKWKTINTLESLLIGNFYNSIIPGNLGEGVKAWHFSRKNNLSFMRSIAALLTEKWLDAHLFLLFGLVLFCFQPFQSHFIHYSIITVMATVISLSLLYFVMQKFRWAKKKIWSIAFLYKKAGVPLFKTYLHVCFFLKFLWQKKTLLLFLLIGHGVFALNVLQYYLLFKAAAITLPIGSWATAYLVSISMVVIIAIPSAPGNIGVLHYGVYSSLILAAHSYGIVPDAALLQTFALYTVYLYLSCFIPEVLLGLIVVIKERKMLF